MRARIGLIVMLTIGMFGLTAPAAADAPGCPSKPFVGSITRSEDAARDQPAGDWSGREVKRALAFDFKSARNTTVYLASYSLDAKDLGGTLEAPADEVLVTVFLRPKTADLAPGKRLKSPRDMITVLIDSGGGAQATTSGARARAQVIEFNGDDVCFSIDYRDDLQRLKGRVHATVG